MTRVAAAIIVSALVVTGGLTHGVLLLTDASSSYSVIETHSPTPGASAVTITGPGRTPDSSRLQATVRFLTDPAQRRHPQIIVVSDTQLDPDLAAQTLARGDIIATVAPTADSEGVIHDLTLLLRGAQTNDDGPFGQIFTNPTPPPPSRING